MQARLHPAVEDVAIRQDLRCSSTQNVVPRAMRMGVFGDQCRLHRLLVGLYCKDQATGIRREMINPVLRTRIVEEGYDGVSLILFENSSVVLSGEGEVGLEIVLDTAETPDDATIWSDLV